MIAKCCDCLFVCLPEFLFLKLCNKCENVVVGVVLFEHGKKCDIAAILSLVSMKRLKVALLCNTLGCTVPQLYQFL